jgi:hypothetical protein
MKGLLDRATGIIEEFAETFAVANLRLINDLMESIDARENPWIAVWQARQAYLTSIRRILDRLNAESPGETPLRVCEEGINCLRELAPVCQSDPLLAPHLFRLSDALRRAVSEILDVGTVQIREMIAGARFDTARERLNEMAILFEYGKEYDPLNNRFGDLSAEVDHRKRSYEDSRDKGSGRNKLYIVMCM